MIQEIRESLEALIELGGELSFDDGVTVCACKHVWVIFEAGEFLTASTDLDEVLYIAAGIVTEPSHTEAYTKACI